MPVLSLSSQQSLIEIAKETLKACVQKRPLPVFHPSEPALLESLACFVTLRKGGALRGCVGVLVPRVDLFQEVMRMTQAAASEDFRFPPVRPEELQEIDIEISVISPLEKVASLREIEIGRHGIYLQWKERTGAFLPEVAWHRGGMPKNFSKPALWRKL